MSDGNYNPSSLSYVDLRSESVRQMVHEAYVAMRGLVEHFVGWGATNERNGEAIREIGGVDRSAEQFHKLLALTPPYVRRFHDDGCPIQLDDLEFGGHDAAEGCEFSDENEGEVRDGGSGSDGKRRE